MVQPSRQLADDHLAIDAVLKGLKTALESGAVETSHAKLDLFWARLAVHIRAEHLHLFPTIMESIWEKDAPGPLFTEAETAIDQLCEDHNFFMRELAGAIQTIRTLDKLEDLKQVQKVVLEIEKRLINHNELEENKVYQWARNVLSEQQQTELTKKIEHELANRPPRFSAEAWQHS